MHRISALVVGGVSALVGHGLWRPTVRAIGAWPELDSGETEAVEERQTLVKPSHMNIYDDPAADRFQYVHVEEELSDFRLFVSDLRKGVWNACNLVMNSTAWTRRQLQTSYDHTMDLVHYVQDHPQPPRLAAITVAGLGGYLFASFRRRNIFKRLLYPITAAAAMAAVCYPNEALTVAMKDYDLVKTYFWPVEGHVSEIRDEQDTVGKTEISVSEELHDPALGQGKEEDKDMYTRRSI